MGSMEQFKCIKTRYGGVLFRSRLEARWAYFFDQIGINWTYEPSTFTMPNNVFYKPDFLVKLFGSIAVWYEIKYKHHDKGTKMLQFRGELERSGKQNMFAAQLNGDPFDSIFSRDNPDQIPICPNCLCMLHENAKYAGIMDGTQDEFICRACCESHNCEYVDVNSGQLNYKLATTCQRKSINLSPENSQMFRDQLQAIALASKHYYYDEQKQTFCPKRYPNVGEF